MKKLSSVAVLGCALLLNTITANAIAVGTYNLSNHNDGAVSPPKYGLRLDGLLTNNTNEEYTFDFDHALSNMTLVYNGSSIVISGVAYGGEDNGSGYFAGTTALWTINFAYNVGVTSSNNGGLSDLKVNADYLNFGSLTSSLGSFQLANKADMSGLSFQLGDEGGAGHRGEPGISGWGWLRHGADCATKTDCVNVESSDWLFTATEAPQVPVPAAAWLMGSALIGLAGIARRKK